MVSNVPQSCHLYVQLQLDHWSEWRLTNGGRWRHRCYIATGHITRYPPLCGDWCVYVCVCICVTSTWPLQVIRCDWYVMTRTCLGSNGISPVHPGQREYNSRWRNRNNKCYSRVINRRQLKSVPFHRWSGNDI